MGCSVVRQLFGAKRRRDRRPQFQQSIATPPWCWAFCWASAGISLAKPILRCSTPKTPCCPGQRISCHLCLWHSSAILSITCRRIFTGLLGDSKRPLYFLMISAGRNVSAGSDRRGPSPYGRCRCRMGHRNLPVCVRSGICSGAGPCDPHPARIFRRTPPRFSRSVLWGDVPCCSLSPLLSSSAVLACSHTVLQRLVNTYGVTFMAGYEAASKIHNFVYMCFNTIGTALSSFAAENYAAISPSGSTGGRRLPGSSLSVTAVALLILQLFPAQRLISMFVNVEENPGIVDVGRLYLRIISPGLSADLLYHRVGGGNCAPWRWDGSRSSCWSRFCDSPPPLDELRLLPCPAALPELLSTA